MGIRTSKRKRSPKSHSSESLADALFTHTQQKVLGLLFGQPDRSFFATEVIGLAGAGSGGVQRQLSRLESSGLVTVTRVGTQKHYQANPRAPLFEELTSIARKTFGITEPIRRALSPLIDDMVAAFVYGSVAKRTDTALSDIDLMIVSDHLSYADVFPLLEPLGASLGRVVNPTIYTYRALARRLKERNSFLVRVLKQPKFWIKGTEDDIRA